MSAKARKSVPTAKTPRLKFLHPQLGHLLLASFIFVTLYFIFFPRVAELRDENPNTSAFIECYKDKEHRAGRIPQVSLIWKPLRDISPNLKNAVLIAEDDSFFEHGGIDLNQLKHAYMAWQKGKRMRGASTITQQLAKNLFLSPSRNPLRKLREALIALRLEAYLSKDRIFELYLNLIEWGPGIYGAESASQHYFNEPAAQLSKREAAHLAAMIPNPIALAQKSKAKILKSREAKIFKRLEYYPPKFLNAS